MDTPNNVIDFSSKDFAMTQKMLETDSQLKQVKSDLAGAKTQRDDILKGTFKEDEMSGSSNDVITENLNKFPSVEELKRYLGGSLDNENVKSRIYEFFTDENGEVLEMLPNEAIKTEAQKLDFMRNLLIYFKQGDYYIQKIEEEQAKLEEAQAEFDRDMSSVLNPLKDNVLAYAGYLESTYAILEDDDYQTKKEKKVFLKKAAAIKNGYELRNIIDMVKAKPSIMENAIKDFRKEDSIKAIGKRYSSKLNSNGVTLNLFNLLSDDPKESLEYRCLPLDEYPAGYEGFTVFFIIRYLSMGLTTIEDQYFQSSVYIAFTRLMEDSLEDDVKETVKGSIKEFLSYVPFM